ncbi:hypothetical protein ACHAPJ_008326 [Fusarium lateritium]
MEFAPYNVNLGGDIELVLENPNTKQVVPQLNLVQFRTEPSTDQTPGNSPGSGSENSGSEDSDSENDSSEPTNVFTLAGDPSAMSSLDGIPAGFDGAFIEVRMRASSSLLTLVSPVIKNILRLPFTYSGHSDHPARELEVDGWDAEALAIVLKVIHGRHRQVPRKVDFVLMANIAIIADYYQCAEALQLSAELWYSFGDKPPTEFSEESVMWLGISWTFSWPTLFPTMLQQFLGHFEDKIECMRIELIGKILAGLDELQETLSLEIGCPESVSAACSSLTLGALVRGKHEIGDRNSELASPYNGHSITSIINMISDFSQPFEPHCQWKAGKRPAGANSVPFYCKGEESGKCTVLGRMQPVIEKIQKEMKGFGLGDFIGL